MEFEDTSLYEDARLVITSRQNGAKRTVRCIVHLLEGELTTEPMYVTAVNIERDYVNKYADVITVSTIMGLGQYMRKIYPIRNNFKITLSFRPLDESAAPVADELIYSQKYHAVLIEGPNDPSTVGSGAENTNEDSLDLKSLINVDFQLIEECVHQLRVASTSGTFRNVQVEPVLKVLIGSTSKRADVDDKQALKLLEVKPLNNEKKYNQIVIPPDIKAVDLPNFLQKYYGMYNSGLGSYIFKNAWYIYPMYEFVSLNDALKTLTLIVMPKNKYREVENTFLVNGDSTIVLITGDTKFMSSNSVQSLEYGTGVRYMDANTVLQDPETKDNKTSVSRQERMSEYSAFESENKLTNVRYSESKVTANPFHENSNIAETMGSYFDCQWNNCDPNLILPGMPCNVTYFEYEKVMTMKAVILAASYSSIKVSDPSSAMHTTTGRLRLFIEDFNREVKPVEEWQE